jgi:hypothetical protein
MEGKVETQNVNVPSNVKVSENQSQDLQKSSAGKTEQEVAAQPRSIAGLYITPVIQFDSQALSVIFQVRDGLSGEVKQEYPQESVIKGREETTTVDKNPSVNIDTDIQPVETSKSAVPQEKVALQSASVDLNTTPADSNGATAIASTTVGIATGLGGA